MSANLSLRRRRITARVKAIKPSGNEIELGLDNITEEPERYLLIERNIGSAAASQSHWFSTHPSRAAAARAVVGQEYPEDWQVVELLDLDTKIRYVDVPHVTWTVAADG